MGLEELVSHPDIWRGRAKRTSRSVLATGFASLDRCLPGGGWPIGALMEIFVKRYGIGELSLLMPALARLSRQQDSRRWIFWIAPPFIPYAPALSEHGVDLERILLVHPSSGGRDNLWAIEQALRFGACSAVLAWLQFARQNALRRLQLAAEECQCWVVLFRPVTGIEQKSPAALRLRLVREHAATQVNILPCRGALPQQIDLPFMSGDGEAEWS